MGGGEGDWTDFVPVLIHDPTNYVRHALLELLDLVLRVGREVNNVAFLGRRGEKSDAVGFGLREG